MDSNEYKKVKMHSPISLSNHVACFCICLFIFIHTEAILHEITFYTLFCHEYLTFFLTLLFCPLPL